MLEVARRGDSPFACPLCTDKPCAKRRRGAYGGTVGPATCPVGLRMQPPNEECFTLFSEAGANLVERVAMPLAARSGSVIAAAEVRRPDADRRSARK